MTFWIDADSCAAGARELAARRALKLGVSCVLVACRKVLVPEGAVFRLVEAGPEAADNLIVADLVPGDLVVTRDLFLARRVLELGATPINDRGQVWDEDGLRERLSLAEFAKVLYNSGIEFRGSHGYGKKDAGEFARGLDRWLGADSRKASSDGAGLRR